MRGKPRDGSKNPGGRPRKKINWLKVAKLCARQWTQEEIASELNIAIDTLHDACLRDNGQSFSKFFAIKRLRGLGSLRSRQYELAMKGNPTMLVWLGKNWIGQKDKADSGVGQELLSDLVKEMREEHKRRSGS